MTTLLLIRHGESAANEREIYVGQTDVPLTERGKQQAEATANYINGNYKVDAIYSSDLIRAYMTAEELAAKIGTVVRQDKDLREIDAGIWEGVPLRDMSNRFGEAYSSWLNDIGNATCTGGESIRELGQRVLSSIKRIVEENMGKTVAVATHATPIRVLQCLLCNKDFDEMKNIPWVTNASVTTIISVNGQFKIEVVGYDRHLDKLKTDIPSNI